MMTLEQDDVKLNLSPFRLYIFVNQWNASPGRIERLQQVAERISKKYFKAELILFDRDQQRQAIINDKKVDSDLYHMITSADMIARVFPARLFDYTFRPDRTPCLPEDPMYLERLETKANEMMIRLIGIATGVLQRPRRRLNMGNSHEAIDIEEYLDSLNEEQKEWTLREWQRKYGFPDIERSRKNLMDFLTYQFERDRDEEREIHLLPGDIDYGQLPPSFKIVVSESPYNYTRHTHGMFDISIVMGDGTSITPYFPTRSSKMTYLMILLATKFSFGLPEQLYKFNKDALSGRTRNRECMIIHNVMRIVQYEIDGYIDNINLRNDLNFINNQTFARNISLSMYQRFWISAYTEQITQNNVSLNVRKVRMPTELIEIEYQELADFFKERTFPSIDTYARDYIPNW